MAPGGSCERVGRELCLQPENVPHGALASPPGPRCPEGSPRSPCSVLSERAEPFLFRHRKLAGT